MHAQHKAKEQHCRCKLVVQEYQVHS